MAAQQKLFWTVYKIDKGLSLRLGRCSNIRDDEIMLPELPNDHRAIRVARIQGKVYDQLYGPMSLRRSDIERGHMAETLAEEARGLVNEVYVELAVRLHSYLILV